MIEIPKFDTEGNEADPLEFDPDMLGGEVTIPLLHQVVTAYEANQRTGTASAKTRGEVSYSTKKPWPQKGTGRARHGDRGSPIWVGGGTTHGPHNRDFTRNVPDKMKRRARDEAILSKIQDGELVLVEAFQMQVPRTSVAVEYLEELNLEGDKLILTGEQHENSYLAVRNLPDTDIQVIDQINAYEILNARWLIIEDEPFRHYLRDRIETLHGVDLDEIDADDIPAEEE